MTRFSLAIVVAVGCSSSPRLEPASPRTPAPPTPQSEPTQAGSNPAPVSAVAAGDLVALGKSAQVKLGDPAAGPAWCWKEPRTVPANDHRRAFAFVLLQRTMLHVLRTASTADDALGDIKALREERLANKTPFYFITPVPFDGAALTADGIHVVQTGFPATAQAFDQQGEVLQLELQLQGFVTIPGGGEALRVGLERRTIRGAAPFKSSGLAVSEYCVVFEPPSSLTIYRRLVLHS